MILMIFLLTILMAVRPGGYSIMDDGQEHGTTPGEALRVVQLFNEAFNRHDVDAIMSLMTEDVLFENTNPPPDGARFKGTDAVRTYWQQFFAANPTAHFDAEEIFESGDRVVVRWVYTKLKDGKPWHLRGVDIFKVRDGKVAEKLSYVKG